ncbi:hypothetical protein BLNAU_16547 [Blattamonas nauphoetae]|uniref:Uncharacterized protein n=1 Tax=Blattamonas nauphoetae TaxID=2049346 RepID=A0ABQ9X889_9EUKA|nr:hypothetical protein BLNAU_16547 [Blattamonas nauphoetae]
MQIKQASPIQLKIGQFVSTEQQKQAIQQQFAPKIWSKVQLLKDILSEKYSNSNNLKFRNAIVSKGSQNSSAVFIWYHYLLKVVKISASHNMIDQCEFCTLLILPESSVEPSNIDSTLTKLTITINGAVYKPTTSTLRESQSSITHKPSACEVKDRTSHLASDIKSFTTHSGFDQTSTTASCWITISKTPRTARAYFSCRSRRIPGSIKRRPPHKHVLVDYADRVALCAPPQLHQTSDTDFASQLTQLTLTKGSLITNASIIDTHSASMPISHARTISRNDTLPDDESDIPTAATLVMSVHSPLASLAARHSALASLAARHSALASLSTPLCTRFLAPRLCTRFPRSTPLCTPSLAPCLCTRFPCCTPLCTRFPRSMPLCTRVPRFTPLCTPSLAARLSALAFLAPRLSAPALPTATQTYPDISFSARRSY